MLTSIWSVLKQVDVALLIMGGVANGDVLRAYLGLLTQAKRDFDAIASCRGDAFFKQSVCIQPPPGGEPDCGTWRRGVRAGPSA